MGIVMVMGVLNLTNQSYNLVMRVITLMVVMAVIATEGAV
jgi:hypothetical protein